MSILNISIKTKLIAIKIASIFSVKKTAKQPRNIKAICLTLFIGFFSVENQAKSVFDVTFEKHNSNLKTNLGVIVIDDYIQIISNDKLENKVFKQDNSALTTEKRAIVYSNGMFTSPVQAANNLNTVRRSFQYTANTSKFYLAYNQSEDVLNQVAEVAAQHLKQQNNLTERQAWFQFAYKSLLPHLYNVLENTETAIASINEASYVNDVDLNSHINQYYLPLLQDEHKVVILSHSQGNFYANRAWNTIASMTNGSELTKGLGIVGVADVASYVAGNGLHTTNSNDLIVKAVRLLSGSQPLPANVTHPLTSKDLLGHGLSEIYLNDDLDARHIKAKLQADVNTMFSRLVPANLTTCENFSASQSPQGPGGGTTWYTYDLAENFSGHLTIEINAYNEPMRASMHTSPTDYMPPINNDRVFNGRVRQQFYYNSESYGAIFIGIGKSRDGSQFNIICP